MRDLHYSYSDIMELPLGVYHELFDIYEREHKRAEIARMHAELNRMRGRR